MLECVCHLPGLLKYALVQDVDVQIGGIYLIAHPLEVSLHGSRYLFLVRGDIFQMDGDVNRGVNEVPLIFYQGYKLGNQWSYLI